PDHPLFTYTTLFRSVLARVEADLGPGLGVRIRLQHGGQRRSGRRSELGLLPVERAAGAGADVVRGPGPVPETERGGAGGDRHGLDRKSTRLNSSHLV